MRHGKSFNHLSRKPAHRKAMLSNMASSLIQTKRITTTVAKAKALRKYVEPLITKAKTDTTHSRRVVFSYLQDKYAVQTLFDEVASKIMERPGGYTRIIKMGNRLGDNADMALIELVDYNELLLEEKKADEKPKTRRSRRGGKKKSSDEAATQAKESKPEEAKTESTDSVIEDAEVVEEVKEEKKVEETPEAKAEETSDEAQTEEKKEDKPSDDAEEKKD